MRSPHVLGVKNEKNLFFFSFLTHDDPKFLSVCKGSSTIHESQDAMFQEANNGSSTCGTDMALGAWAQSTS